ncbi:hypothetical protein [Salinarimonas ramus]|uniref:Uncharacterized protein n=1 Tax=Salinarimonas ramus TaxID=690164 RepID=A0A917QFU4_9HYPH|nr:hypothetical protein [Salinarimonas ramus]GGK49345.1 hypothetical protein GCM10011322_40480 [Salinarimonas ramus]
MVLDAAARTAILTVTEKQEPAMSYTVTWRVVGPDGGTVEDDVFPDAFARHEDALAFVLDKLSMFPRLGFDRERGFWGRGAGGDRALETRFCVTEVPAFSPAVPRD